MEGSFFLNNWFYEGMRWIYYNIANGGIIWTIVIATVLMKIITLPLDIKSRKSTMKMSAIQPDIEKLKKKYASNPQKLNQEQAKLMKEKGVSLYAGCLPMVIMMVMFICFLSAFRYWSNENMTKIAVDLNQGKTETFQEAKWLWVNNIWQPDTMSPVIMTKTEFEKIEFDKMTALDKQTIETVKTSVIPNYDNIQAAAQAVYPNRSNGWYILPLLAGASMFLSSLISMKANPQQAATGGTSKMMMYLFPVIGIIAGLQSSSAFAIYWIISNLTTAITQIALNKIYPRNSTVVEEAV